jgi:hypothetical protein
VKRALEARADVEKDVGRRLADLDAPSNALAGEGFHALRLPRELDARAGGRDRAGQLAEEPAKPLKEPVQGHG